MSSWTSVDWLICFDSESEIVHVVYLVHEAYFVACHEYHRHHVDVRFCHVASCRAVRLVGNSLQSLDCCGWWNG